MNIMKFNPFPALSKFTEKLHLRGIILFFVIIFAVWSSATEKSMLRKWATSAFHQVQVKEQQVKVKDAKIGHLEQRVQEEANKPPKVIVKEKKVYEKPFANPTLLDRARKLREQQRTSENNHR